MKLNYKEILEKHGQFITILCCMLGDAFISLYTYAKASNYAFYEKILVLITQANGIDAELIDKNLLRETYELTVNLVLTMLVVYVVVQLVMYIFYLRNKKIATGHVFLYSLTGAMGLLLLGVTEIANLNAVAFLALGQGTLFVLASYLSGNQLKKIKKSQELEGVPHRVSSN